MISSGVLTQVIDKETIKVKIVGSNEDRELKGNKFYVSDLAEAYENEEIVLVKFYSDTNIIIDNLKEGDF